MAGSPSRLLQMLGDLKAGERMVVDRYMLEGVAIPGREGDGHSMRDLVEWMQEQLSGFAVEAHRSLPEWTFTRRRVLAPSDAQRWLCVH